MSPSPLHAPAPPPSPSNDAEPPVCNIKHKRVTSRANTERLLAVARRMFDTMPYAAVTTRGVAKAAGQSTGVLFARFNSKHELYEAVYGAKAPDALTVAQLEEKAQYVDRLCILAERLLSGPLDGNMRFEARHLISNAREVGLGK